MGIVIGSPTIVLWQDLVKAAEARCSVDLTEDLECYLVSLLMRYLDKPEVAKQVFATAFLEALQLQKRERQVTMQHVGDQCLLYAGLFPRAAEKKRVKVVYFVDLGRSAYSAVSKNTNDLFSSLAMEFVVLMDVLQSIALRPELLPLEAYDQWKELGSKRSLQILQEYTRATPFKPHR
jgi:hypothetical protein